MGRNVITKKALTLEQFTGFVKEKRGCHVSQTYINIQCVELCLWLL